MNLPVSIMWKGLFSIYYKYSLTRIKQVGSGDLSINQYKYFFENQFIFDKIQVIPRKYLVKKVLYFQILTRLKNIMWEAGPTIIHVGTECANVAKCQTCEFHSNCGKLGRSAIGRVT